MVQNLKIADQDFVSSGWMKTFEFLAYSAYNSELEHLD